MRRHAEAAIEQLIVLVDAIDGDADCEEDGNLEPSLGTAEHGGSQARWGQGARDDREDEHDGREPDVDDELSGDEDEPALGAFDRGMNQDHAWRQRGGPNWPLHCNSDLEAETI